MGSPPGSGGLPDEQPARLVYLSAFLIDRREVTQEAYAGFVTATGHRTPQNANPASTVWIGNLPMTGI
ncbi:MAG TPA: SUMF1/EgtB/PvdO family nonheme iron enzyme, partial [Nitrospiraceae bacterium]